MVSEGPLAFAAYLRDRLGLTAEGSIDAPVLPCAIDAFEYRDPPFHVERTLSKSWEGLIQRREASRPVFWTLAHIRWLEDDQLGAQERRWLGGAPGGRSFGCGPEHRVPGQAALCRGRVGGGLRDRPQANWPRKLDDRGEAHPVSSTGQALIAPACSPSPEGHDHWTLRLLAGKVVELGLAPSTSHEGVRKRPNKTPSSRGRSRSGAFPR